MPKSEKMPDYCPLNDGNCREDCRLFIRNDPEVSFEGGIVVFLVQCFPFSV